MGVGLKNYPNITPGDSDYPDGRIKDDTGADDGTPIDLLTNGDIQETFAKLLRLANIIPSGTPDNEYSGHQYIDALIKMILTNTSGSSLTVIESESNQLIKTAVFSIGDWNMDTTSPVNVSIGSIDFKKIRSICVIIRDDNDTGYYDLTRINNSSGLGDGTVTQINSSGILIDRTISGFFDSTTFDSTSYNRGWITIQYIQ